MRLGELLLQRRAVSEEQLRAALNAQESYGERLGTNLVQLGYLDVDVVSRALGEQRGATPALKKHVAAIDKRVLSLFTARTVTTYKVIPLGYNTQTKPARLIVACADPGALPLEEVAFAAGTRVDVWIAPELLVQECLERYYGAAAKPSRYLDVNFIGDDSHSSSPPMMGGAPDLAPRVRASAVPRAASPPLSLEPPLSPGPLSPPPPPSHQRVSLLSPPPPPPMAPLLEPPPQSARRPPPAPPRSAPVLEMPPAPDFLPPSPPPSPLHATPPPPFVAPPEQRAAYYPEAEDELPSDDGWEDPVASEAARRASSVPPPMLRPIIDQAEASRMIEMATSKEHVGRVLTDWLRSTFGCGMVLVVKHDVAVGWQGFFPDAEDLVEAVTIPLTKPSMFSRAYDAQAPFFGAPPVDGAKLNQLFWKLLRCSPPYEILICPVVLAKRTVNLVYAHPDGDNLITDTNYREAQVLASDAAAAYMRLIRKERGVRSNRV